MHTCACKLCQDIQCTDSLSVSQVLIQLIIYIYKVDRSPCGSGVTAKVALEYYKGTIKLGQYKLAHLIYCYDDT